MNQVFLSYRQENDAHVALVRNLATRLRDQKFPLAFDQFVKEERPGGPDENWLRWAERCAEKSSCVLIVCSKGWFDSYRGHGPAHSGMGAALEAEIFAQEIYDKKGYNERIRLVIVDDFTKENIPLRLRSWEVFSPNLGGQYDGLTRWIRQRLAMPGSPGSPPKTVFLASCASDMRAERKSLASFLKDKGWEVRPHPEDSKDFGDEKKLRENLGDSVAFVQLFESYPRDSGIDQLQQKTAREMEKKLILYLHDKIKVEEAEPDHKAFLKANMEVITGPFDDFRENLVSQLARLWESKKPRPAPTEGIRRGLVRVIIRSPHRDTLWKEVFAWIDREPDIRPHLLEEDEYPLDKHDPSMPCHGFLVVCDESAQKTEAESIFSTKKDMEHCSLIQLKEKDDSRLPPTGLVYWPPPDPAWSRLQQIAPPKLYRILGNAPEHDLKKFFADVRKAFA